MSQRPRRVDLQREPEPEPEPEPQSTMIYVDGKLDKDGLTVLVVDLTTTADLETMGILEQFYPDRYEVMKARAQAYGYTLERRYE
jgi:hypothetical protein